MMLQVCLLVLLSVGLGAASSTTAHVPVTEINYFLENGEAPLNAELDFPKFLTSTIIVAVNPVERIYDTAEVTVFGQAMKYFYEQIFDSQSEFDLTIRSVDVVGQTRQEEEKALEMETIVDVNFRQNSTGQDLTDEEFHNILLNLVNTFETDLVEYLRNHHVVFGSIQSVKASSLNSEESDDTGADNVWLYIVAGVGGFVVISALVASYVLYKREWQMPRYVAGSRNLSPFRQDGEIEFPDKDTLVLDDDDDTTYGSNPRFSFQPNGAYPDSPPSIYNTTPSRVRSSFAAAHDHSLDNAVPTEDPEDAGRAELWAPAGKLGVAIDVVDGRPIVWRIKAGSSLEGFFAKG
mmetsp:Transcript_30262/g.50012  ORF Transcript_30262/g.50012 Transcript_30262/m.50012 type:complete len:349 (-) Transcript_30262:1044-2090(-)